MDNAGADLFMLGAFLLILLAWDVLLFGTAIVKTPPYYSAYTLFSHFSDQISILREHYLVNTYFVTIS
jgi:hypothetical protein